MAKNTEKCTDKFTVTRDFEINIDDNYYLQFKQQIIDLVRGLANPYGIGSHEFPAILRELALDIERDDRLNDEF